MPVGNFWRVGQQRQAENKPELLDAETISRQCCAGVSRAWRLTRVSTFAISTSTSSRLRKLAALQGPVLAQLLRDLQTRSVIARDVKE